MPFILTCQIVKWKILKQYQSLLKDIKSSLSFNYNVISLIN